MPNLRSTLKNRLKPAKKIAFLGIGSPLRGDDAAGAIIACEIKRSLRGKDKPFAFKVFSGETAPENLTGEIKKFKPTHLVIVDSVDLKELPGVIRLIEPHEVKGISFSTHRLPIKFIIDYLLLSISCEILIIGIQPKSIEFNQSVSREVKLAITKIADALIFLTTGSGYDRFIRN